MRAWPLLLAPAPSDQAPTVLVQRGRGEEAAASERVSAEDLVSCAITVRYQAFEIGLLKSAGNVSL